MQSIVRSHPLIDGNKRLGRLAPAVFLHLNGLPAEWADNDAVYDLVMAVAEGDEEVEAIATALRELVGDGDDE
jgi:death-on-curing protein